jgi:calcium/calmodulin-dependent protein kinase (CaM kinase) II
MTPERDQEILDLTQRLLDSVTAGDWDTYARLCDESLSCFEPEARGHLVHGLEFHRFYFDNLSHRLAVNTTMATPHVRFVGDDVAVISYVRLMQRIANDGTPGTTRFEETRVWQRQKGHWKLVHLHRSGNS